MSQMGTYNIDFITTLTGDSGGDVGPIQHNINIVGGIGGISVEGNDSTGTLIINGSGTVPSTWFTQTATPAQMISDAGYVQALPSSALLLFKLPLQSAVGALIMIVGKSPGGWQINQNFGQSIRFGDLSTTATTGYLASTNQWDNVILVCRDQDTVWSVISAVGILNVV